MYLVIRSDKVDKVCIFNRIFNSVYLISVILWQNIGKLRMNQFDYRFMVDGFIIFRESDRIFIRFYGCPRSQLS